MNGLLKVSEHKQNIYLNSQTSNRVTKIHCRKYCRILTQAIKEIKHMHYSEQVLDLCNKEKQSGKL